VANVIFIEKMYTTFVKGLTWCNFHSRPGLQLTVAGLSSGQQKCITSRQRKTLAIIRLEDN